MTKDELREWLESYRDIRKERDGILELIGELEEDRAGSQLRSPQLTGMPRSGRISDPTASSAARFAALMTMYEEQAAALYDRMREIEEAIESLPSLHRDMLRRYYLRGKKKTWAEVAREKNFSEPRCWQIASAAIDMLLESL